MAFEVPSMKGKVCLVTGASSGVGFETAKALAAAGAQVAMVGRHPDRSLQAVKQARGARKGSDVRLYLSDLSDLDAVRTLAKQVRSDFKRLDVLVNNAAVLLADRRTTKQGLEATFVTNYLSHFLLTLELLPMMKKSAPARVVNLTSGLYPRGKIDFDDLQMETSYDLWQAYANSKLANVLFTKELSRRLLGTAVTTNVVFPGMVRTRWSRDAGARGRFVYALMLPFSTSPRKGARPVVRAASDPSLDRVSGQYFQRMRLTDVVPQADDKELAARLWDESIRLSGAKWS
jgi:retinol dehydrogenase 12